MHMNTRKVAALAQVAKSSRGGPSGTNARATHSQMREWFGPGYRGDEKDGGITVHQPRTPCLTGGAAAGLVQA